MLTITSYGVSINTDRNIREVIPLREWLREFREGKKMSQEEVGQATGLKQSSYSMIEIGERNPSVEAAKKIAAVLEFDWTKFYEDEREPTAIEASKEEAV